MMRCEKEYFAHPWHFPYVEKCKAVSSAKCTQWGQWFQANRWVTKRKDSAAGEPYRRVFTKRRKLHEKEDRTPLWWNVVMYDFCIRNFEKDPHNYINVYVPMEHRIDGYSSFVLRCSLRLAVCWIRLEAERGKKTLRFSTRLRTVANPAHESQ